MTAAQAQKVDQAGGPMVFKGGTLIFNGEKLKTREAVIGAIGEDIYTQTWKSASTMRKTGITLMSVGSGLAAWGLAGYITAQCVEWPEQELEPERWNKFNTAYTVTKCVIVAGLGCLGAGIPLFCIGNGRMKWVRDNYNQGLTVSTAPGGLGLSYRF